MNRLSAWWQAEAGFDPLLAPYRARADGIMVGMNVFLCAVSLALAVSTGQWIAFLLVAPPTLALSVWLARTHRGGLVTRLFMGASFMVLTGLLIHQTEGSVEAHFTAFGLVAILLYYRDWRTVASAVLAIFLHHLVLGYVQTLGVPVIVFDSPHYWHKLVLHLAYFIPFAAMMAYLGIWLRREGAENQQVISIANHIIRGDLDHEADLSAEMRETELIQAVLSMKARLMDLLRVMPVAAAVIRVETETLVSVNAAWERLLGPLAGGSAIARAPIWAHGRDWRRLQARLKAMSTSQLEKAEVTLTGAGGQRLLCEVSLILHRDTTPVMAIMTIEDVTQRRLAEGDMKRLAYRDALTGLPNRTSAQDAMAHAMTAWQRERTPFAVVMLDLDGFKPVNDTHGHDAGDEVLRTVGERLARYNRGLDVAARLGGDEFTLVLAGCPSLDEAVRKAQQLIAAISQPIVLCRAGVTVTVGASAGVAGPGDATTDVAEVIKRADKALYKAKAAGKGRVVSHRCAREAGVEAEAAA